MANHDEERPIEVLRNLPAEQSTTAAPVVPSPELPAMEEVGAVKTVHRNTLLPLMGAGADSLLRPPRDAPFPERPRS